MTNQINIVLEDKKPRVKREKFLPEITKSSCLAEVELTYKSKVKPSLREKISDSKSCYDIFRHLFNDKIIEHHEEMIILMLNRANKVLGWTKISQGGLAGTVVDIKLIMQAVILSNASSFIVAHNHPSDNLRPSQADIKITKNMKEAAKIMDLVFFDHLIITSESYYSFADEGML